MSYRLENWTTAQMYMKMNENVKKEGKKNRKEREEDGKKEKRRKQKIKLTFRWTRDLKFRPIAQKWMTMNENVKKEETNEKNERKMKKTEKAKTKS